MRAGRAPAAALWARATGPTPVPAPRHCPAAEYVRFVAAQAIHPQYRAQKLRTFRRFVARWPDLTTWFSAPLAERVGRLWGERAQDASFPLSHEARPYLVYLGLRGYATFDYPWMFCAQQLLVRRLTAALGLDLGIDALVDEGVALGFDRATVRNAMQWSVSRIALHTGFLDATAITDDHLAEALEAIRHFGARPDLERFAGRRAYRLGQAKNWTTHLHQLQIVLFHRGQVATQPRKRMPTYAPPGQLPPRMRAAADRWLAARRLTDRPATVAKLELAVRRFGEWLGREHPTIETFADVTRADWSSPWTPLPHPAHLRPGHVLPRYGRLGLARCARSTVARSRRCAAGAGPRPPLYPCPRARSAHGGRHAARVPFPARRPLGRPLVRRPSGRGPAPGV